MSSPKVIHSNIVNSPHKKQILLELEVGESFRPTLRCSNDEKAQARTVGWLVGYAVVDAGNGIFSQEIQVKVRSSESTPRPVPCLASPRLAAGKFLRRDRDDDVDENDGMNEDV